MLKLNHKKLEGWNLAITFISKIYNVISTYPKDELYSLVNQIRRASVSIALNIAEGASRKSLVERKRFFEISRSSLVEVDAQLEISQKLNLIPDHVICELDKDLNELFAKLSNLIQKAK